MKSGDRTFCTVINCMDGRIQLPVIRYMKDRFNVRYVDSVTEAGPNAILGEQENGVLIQSILERLNISIEKHNSVGIAVVGHHDCAGNPVPFDEQVVHINESVRFIQSRYTSIEVIGLWVDDNWEVCEVSGIDGERS